MSYLAPHEVAQLLDEAEERLEVTQRELAEWRRTSDINLDTVTAQHERLVRLERMLRELQSYLRPYEDSGHRKHGENCGADACVLCLCQSIVEEAMSVVF